MSEDNRELRQPVRRESAGRVELAISLLLRAGVITSLAIVIAGTAISFFHHPDYLSSLPALQRLTHPGAAFVHSPGEVLRGIRELRGQAIVALGLLLLIATPVMRVLLSTLVFAREGDLKFTLITLLVLVLLLGSFLLGRAGE